MSIGDELDSMGVSGSKARRGRIKIYSDIIEPASPELVEKKEELQSFYLNYEGLLTRRPFSFKL